MFSNAEQVSGTPVSVRMNSPLGYFHTRIPIESFYLDGQTAVGNPHFLQSGSVGYHTLSDYELRQAEQFAWGAADWLLWPVSDTVYEVRFGIIKRGPTGNSYIPSESTLSDPMFWVDYRGDIVNFPGWTPNTPLYTVWWNAGRPGFVYPQPYSSDGNPLLFPDDGDDEETPPEDSGPDDETGGEENGDIVTFDNNQQAGGSGNRCLFPWLLVLTLTALWLTNEDE